MAGAEDLRKELSVEKLTMEPGEHRGTTKAVSTKDLAPVPEKFAKRLLNRNENHEVNNESVNDDKTEYNKLIEVAETRIPNLSL